jgi:hypothetical protein
MQINIRKTIENTVPVLDEFPFYVEELNASDEMPTLLGLADEKYTFDCMNDEFFEFVSRKSNENGVYIRLIHVLEKSRKNDNVTLEIESGHTKTTITTEYLLDDEVTDIGIKICGDEITVGTTDYSRRPRFERIDENVLLSMIADELIDDLIFFD